MLTTAIAPPKTYSEWVAVLDMLKAKSDDEAVLNGIIPIFVKPLLLWLA